MSDSQFLHKEACPKCGSRDNLARFDDGHAYCFSPGCDYYEKASGVSTEKPRRLSMAKPLLPIGQADRLGKRRITEETTRKYSYTIGEDQSGRTCQIANYIRDGQVVAQKVRYPDKSFVWHGDPKQAGLYGQHLYKGGGRKVVITEGEIDALTVAQLQNLRWPTVSVPNGADGAKRDILKELEWVESFDEVVLMFDQDAAGQEAAKKVSEVLTPGRCKIAYLPAKDPNELLKDNRGDEVINAMWEAQPRRPESLKTAADLKQDALAPVEWGLPWPWEPLTEATYGRRRRELYFIGAGTGIGKTDCLLETAEYNWRECGLKSGLIFLETPASEVLVRLAGKVAGKAFHVPDGDWTAEEKEAAITDIADKDAAVFYDHSGASATDWETIKHKIKYMALGLGVKDIFLDHLTALAVLFEDERRGLEELCAELGSLVHELDCTLYVVSHLTTPEGVPHEEGGRVKVRHFKGSRAIGYWAHFMFGLERDTQASNPEERNTTTFRVLKDRYTGKANGMTFHLKLNPDTYRNEVSDPPPSQQESASDHGFDAEGDDF